MDDNDQPGGSWSTEGWTKRPRRKVVTDRTRAERIALGHAARKANLGATLVDLLATRERLAEMRRAYANAWYAMDDAFERLTEAADARKGRYRARPLDAAIDDTLLAFREATRRLAVLDGFEEEPLAQSTGDAVD